MADVFEIQQDDLLPSLTATLTDTANPDGITIPGGATVRFKMRQRGAEPPKVIDEAATIVNAATGEVRYDWQSGDTDTVGTFDAEFEVLVGGSPWSFPNSQDTPLVVKISADIDSADFDQPLRPASGLCAAWATVDDVCCTDTSIPDETLERMLMVASEFLYQKTAQQWPGACSETVRPCRQAKPYPPAWRDRTADLGVHSGNPAWWWCVCGGNPRRNACSCGGVSEIQLPYTNVTITEVKVDGVTLDPTDYRLDDGRWLVRVDGDDWPSTQNMELEDTEDDTFSVTYTYGTAPPTGGIVAAAVLGCELALACSGSNNCRLPSRAQQVVRENTTVVLVDPTQLFEDGKTGLIEVDLFIEAQNPAGLQRGASVFSPHLPALVRRTG